ncbi:MAG: hypothetical protein NZ869_05980 [Thermoanaerobaculum sp.]|nr:hypothetical protein [Thermoanaerobaculum sp.]
MRSPQPPLLVPVIARVAGIGTPWRSDVVLANPSSAALSLTLHYQRSGTSTPVTASVELAPRQAVLHEDAVASLFGQGDGRGSLLLPPPREGPAPAVFTRTFSTQGGVRLGQGIAAAEPQPAGTYTLTGLFEDSRFRSNVGVTAGAFGLRATFELFRGSEGGPVGSVEQSVGPYDQQQWRLPDLFPGQAREGVPMTLRITLSGPGLPWASVVDQKSSDAVFLSAGNPAGVLLVPVVASVQGVVFWDTDLTLANLNPNPTSLTLEFLPENRDNRSGGTATRTLNLAPWETRTLERLVSSFLGLTNTKGALSVVSARPVTTACRVYTPSASGTYGQGVPVVPISTFSSQAKFVTGLRTRDGFRTNVGLVAPTDGVNAQARLYDASGALLAQRSDLFIPGRSLQQFRFEDLFPGATPPHPVGSLLVIPNGPLGVYLSVVDGTSQDPVFLMAP